MSIRRWPGAGGEAHARSVLAGLLAGVSLFLGASAARAEKWKTPTEAEKAIVEDEAKGYVGAVILERRYQSNGLSMKVYVRAKILSRNGFDVATVEGLDRDAHGVAGRTIGPTGKVTELEKKDIRVMTTVKAAGVTLKRKGFTLPALEPGCIIEYHYEESGALGGAGDLHTEIAFQESYPILFQELRHPKVFPFASVLRTNRGALIRHEEDGGNHVYTGTNVAALPKEPYGLPSADKASAVIFIYVIPGLAAKNSEEYWKLATKVGLADAVRQQLIKPGKLAATLKQIAGRREDGAARVQAIYRWVQSGIQNRYALRAGQTEPKGGWKENEDAGDTLERKSGTPSDLAALCASLLRADGWTVRPVFTADREERLFRKEIPSIFQLSGWVLEVRDSGLPGPVYLAFDHPLLPYGVLPWNRVGMGGYAVDLEKETGEVVPIPQAVAARNLEHREWTLTVSEDGAAQVARTSRYSGLASFQQRSHLWAEGKAEHEKEVRESHGKLDPPTELVSLAVEHEEDLEQDFVEKRHWSRPSLAGSLPGGRLAVAPAILMGTANPFTKPTRIEPIAFAYPYREEDNFRVVLPANWAVEALPNLVKAYTEAGNYALLAERAPDGAVIVRRVFEITQFSAPAEQYAEYRKLFETAAREDAGFSVVFRRGAPQTKP